MQAHLKIRHKIVVACATYFKQQFFFNFWNAWTFLAVFQQAVCILNFLSEIENVAGICCTDSETQTLEIQIEEKYFSELKLTKFIHCIA